MNSVENNISRGWCAQGSLQWRVRKKGREEEREIETYKGRERGKDIRKEEGRKREREVYSCINPSWL